MNQRIAPQCTQVKLTTIFVFSIGTIVLLLLPFVAEAQTPSLTWFTNLASQIYSLVRTAVPILTALALLLFIWGVTKYFILGADDEGARETGRQYMLYALVGLLAIVAVWGLVALVLQILGVDADSSVTPDSYFPTVN